MAKIVDHLRMLRDVQGVYGSFVVAGSGSLVDRDLPEAFDEGVLGEVGPRVARLFEAFASGGRDMDTCMLRYSEQKLYVRKMTWGIIGVLSSAAVNLPALRMVLNLVVRRIDPEIGAIATVSARGPSKGPPPLPGRTPMKSAMDSGPPASSSSRSQPAPQGAAKDAGPPASPHVDDADAPVPSTDRPVRMYRGRPVSD
jgi:hypothetical protein